MRVLGRIRLSRLTDESTSAARQREIIEGWAKSNDHEIVGWAEDLDVSGSVDPFSAPALGPWLTERADEWDILCAWKLDRIGRRAIPLNRVFGWILENRKVLVCVSDNIDLSTWVGRLVANVIAGVAEGELEAIRERTKASRKKLLESGRWPGGRVPFGFNAVQLPTGGWRLEVNEEEADVLRAIIRDVVGGEPVKSVAAAYGISHSTVRKWLKGKYLIGHAAYGGKTVRDREGQPILNGEPLLTMDEWNRLQAVLEERTINPGKKYRLSPMSGVVQCLVCGEDMHHHSYTRDYGKKSYRYYYCKDKEHTGMVDAETVEGILEEAFLAAVGDQPVRQRVYRPAEDHQTELDEAVRAVGELSSMLGSIQSATMTNLLTEQLSALDKRIAELEQLPSRPAGYDFKETGSTFKTAWDISSLDERRNLLLDSGIRFAVKRPHKTKVLEYKLYEPEDAADLLNAKNPPTRSGKLGHSAGSGTGQ